MIGLKGALPEGWDAAHRVSVLKHILAVRDKGRDAAEPCLSCPGARMNQRIIVATLPDGMKVTFEDSYIGCIFLDNCIKEYPHMGIVKKEFK